MFNEHTNETSLLRKSCIPQMYQVSQKMKRRTKKKKKKNGTNLDEPGRNRKKSNKNGKKLKETRRNGKNKGQHGTDPWPTP